MLSNQDDHSLIMETIIDPPGFGPTGEETAMNRLLKNRFIELNERDQALAAAMARIETKAALAQTELQEKLTTIIASLTQFSLVSSRIEQLQQEVDKSRKDHDEIKHHETELEASIINLEDKILKLETTNQYLRRERALFDVNVAALIILAIIIFYHVFFGEIK